MGTDADSPYMLFRRTAAISSSAWLLLGLAACGDPGAIEMDPGAMGVIDRGEADRQGGGAGGTRPEDVGAGGQGALNVPPHAADGNPIGFGEVVPDEAAGAEGLGGEGALNVPPHAGDGEGEGEGEELGEDDPPPPARGPREVMLVCGSSPERVVQPSALHLSATVVMPEDICAVHLQPFVNDIDQRKIRILALETMNAAPCAGQRGPTSVTLDIPMDAPEDLGQWTFEFIGLGPTIFRRHVTVEPEGAAPADPGATCDDGRVGFPGECGRDLFCAEPSAGNPVGYACGEDGLCVQSDVAGVLEGEFDVFFNSDRFESGCRLATAAEVPPDQCLQAPPPPPPGGLWDNPLAIDGPASITIEQDPLGTGDDSLATLSFGGHELLSLWSGDSALNGSVIGNTFLAGDTRVVVPGPGACTRIYYLQVPRLTRYDALVMGRLGIIHLEVNCGRGCLACELAGPIGLVED